MNYTNTDFNDKTVLVTGGAGFIGSNLAFHFQENYPRCRVIVFDTFRTEETFGNGNLKSFSLRYIDWEHPEKNVYHVAEEFAVERRGSHETRRPDLVLFVNGIPLGVIECKSPDLKDPMTQAISQQIRNQKEDEIPALFQYTQLLLAISGNEAKYATVGTPAKFWSVWKEESEAFEKNVKASVDQPLSRSQIQALYDAFPGKHRMEAVNSLNLPRVVTAQDRAIYSLCQPERLLELAYGFTLL